VKRLLCRLLGHRWARNPLWHASYAPRYYSCRRCGEPGFWVET
jgi:hypothetical protein